MDRRDFIKLTAITGTSATLAGCGSPENHLIRFIPDEDVAPGLAEWKPSVCPLCAAGCGLLVRVMEGDVEVVRNGQAGVVKRSVAKKLEGNPAHPINQGKLCVRGQAGVQVTYHPDRIGHPLKRSGTRGSGEFRQVTWDDAMGELVSKLDGLAAANDQKSLALWTRPQRSLRHQLTAQFLSRFGAPPPVLYELFGDDVLRRANLLSFGREQVPTFDLARSRYVISFGADFLGTWNSPVAQNIAYGLMRQGRPGVRGRFVQVEPRMSQTGANADEWVAIRPGTEGILALGLAHVILSAKLRPADAAGRAGSSIEGWSGGLAAYTPAEVEQQTGVAAARVERLGRELADQRPALAIIGGAPLAHTNGISQALAVNALNALLGSVAEPGGVFFTPQVSMPAIAGDTPAGGAPAPALQKMVGDLHAAARSPVHVLVVDQVNPIFTTPSAWRVREAIEKIPFIVSFASFIDETSALADLILPDHSFLESWVDSVPEAGTSSAVINVAAPVMKPLLDTRAMPDVLLDISRRLKMQPALPWQTFEEMLHAGVGSLPASSPDAGDVWSAAQRQGGWWREAASDAGTRPRAGAAARTVAVAAPQFDGPAAEFPFHFLPYASSAFLDGSLAHLPWLQELPDPMTSAMWSSWVEINPRTADTLKIAPGDVVEITSQHGTVRAPAVVSPAIAPDVVAMPVGQGHRAFTRYASGRGENPIAILAPMSEPETGALAWAATRVKIARAGGPDGHLILFAGEMRERPYGTTR